MSYRPGSELRSCRLSVSTIMMLICSSRFDSVITESFSQSVSVGLGDENKGYYGRREPTLPIVSRDRAAN